MTRIAGVLALVVGLYGLLYAANPDNFNSRVVIDLLNRHGAYGILTLGVGVLIITGGIDLSIGSVVALSAVGFGVMIRSEVPPVVAAGLVLVGGAVIGTIHGLLVTKGRLQPFLVTLCGLFIYRGLARTVSGIGEKTTEQTVSLTTIKSELPASTEWLDWLRAWIVGKQPNGALDFPMEFVLMLGLAGVLGVVLHGSAYGRYWYAIGHNVQAARYSGINADRHRIIAFVISSMCAAAGGVIWLLDYGTIDPASEGSEFELLAITGAVIGGCSLRGGEGTIPGIVLGAAILPAIYKLNIFFGIPNTVIPIVVGLTLLIGAGLDEILRRRSAGPR